MLKERIARLFRNNWGLKVNLRYFLYHRYCKLRAGNLNLKAADKKAVQKAHQSGLGIIGLADVSELSALAARYFDDMSIPHGSASLSRDISASLAQPVYELVRQLQGPIRAYYGSHFKVNWVEFQKIVPGVQPKGSSFSYHTDDSPYKLIKAFAYLTDTYKNNGAFRAFDYKWTDKLIKKGILKTSQPGAMRDSCQHLISKEDEENLTIVEGKQGTAFIFDNKLIHKGTLPLEGQRIHISLEIMPASRDFTFEDIKRACSREITEYYTLQPFAENNAIG